MIVKDLLKYLEKGNRTEEHLRTKQEPIQKGGSGPSGISTVGNISGGLQDQAFDLGRQMATFESLRNALVQPANLSARLWP